MRPALIAIALALAAALIATSALADDTVTTTYGLSLFGELKYGADFQHFDYVNPDAPKGGTLRQATIGTFDTLNPFQLKGTKAQGSGYVFETLMTPSYDELDSEYGLIAESVEQPANHSWVQFNLRKEARFQDGSPITPEDVIWTFDTLKTHGAPSYRFYYADVVKAEQVGEHGVRFGFRGGVNRELPEILGQLAVLSKKYWENRDFEKTTLDPPLGSGPYKVESFDAGRYITLRRVENYWGKDLPVNRGRYNFDTIHYDYYRDRDVALEAFKAGAYDEREEFTAKNWAVGYDSPALRDGRIIKEEIPNKMPQGMQAFVYNLRRPIFQDRRVREALGYLWDFEWTNKNLFYGQYKRTESWFPNTVFASSGLPGPDELAILDKFRGKIPDEVFTKAWEAPKTDGSGNIRDNLRQALRLLKTARWSIKDEKLVNDQTGQPFTFEVLDFEPDFDRILLPFKQNLERAGITMTVRTVDPAQYQNRLNTFDFDMTPTRYPPVLTPGNEEREFFGSAAVDQQGSYNLAGIKDPVIDELCNLVVAAPSLQALLTVSHVLDRVLLFNYYVIPNYYQSSFHVAYWNKFGKPKENPPYMLAIDTWWSAPSQTQEEPKK